MRLHELLQRKAEEQKPFSLDLKSISFAEEYSREEMVEMYGDQVDVTIPYTRGLNNRNMDAFRHIIKDLQNPNISYSLKVLNDAVLTELYASYGFIKSQLVHLIVQNPRNNTLSAFCLPNVKTLELGYENDQAIRADTLELVSAFPNLENLYIKENISYDCVLTKVGKVLPMLPPSMKSIYIDSSWEEGSRFDLRLLDGLNDSQIKAIHIVNCAGEIPKVWPKTLKEITLISDNFYSSEIYAKYLSSSEAFDWSGYDSLEKIKMTGLPEQKYKFDCVALQALSLGFRVLEDVGGAIDISNCSKLKKLELFYVNGTQLPYSGSLENVLIQNIKRYLFNVTNFNFSSCSNLNSLQLQSFSGDLSTASFPESLQSLILKEVSNPQLAIGEICRNFPVHLSCLMINNINYLEGYKSECSNENQDSGMSELDEKQNKISFILQQVHANPQIEHKRKREQPQTVLPYSGNNHSFSASSSNSNLKFEPTDENQQTRNVKREPMDDNQQKRQCTDDGPNLS